MSTRTDHPATEPKRAHQTVEERAAAGKAARGHASRASHASFELRPGRDPVTLIEHEGVGRVEELLPIRHGRMLASPLAFYRGTAALMAEDLATTLSSGLNVQLCGDAHLSNFGGFASPDRDLVFDLNDFDETLPGPFEWDVKRLATSFEVTGRHRGFSKRERRALVIATVGSYRQSMREFARMSNLAVWYSRLDAARIAEQLQAAGLKSQTRALARAAKKARAKDSSRALARLTHEVDGETRIISTPPLIVPIHELVDTDTDRQELEESIRGLLRGYTRTLPADRRTLVEQYHYVDLARKVVGVGSVGTRCWVVLLLGHDAQDPLVLQVKEAPESVLEPHLGRSRFANRGQRVVEGQRLMQAASDIFLGWLRNPAGLDGLERDFYVRQLWDWKTSVDVETATPQGLEHYTRACGWTLARAHARSGDRAAIAAYLGRSNVFDHAIAEFATAYADLCENDYRALQQAASSGRIPVREG
jgi:uncharacterized protein (DUF2252 family)